MTWGEFKQWAEARGIKDSYKLGAMQFTVTPIYIYVRTSILDKDDVEVDIT